MSSADRIEEEEGTGHDDVEEGGERDHGDRSGEAAGVVRGVSRSILRAPIGQLPRQGRAILTRQRLPVRRVARISDRMATGLDWLNLVAETDGKDKLSVRAGRFAVSLLKNTILGIAVFESYGYLVAAWAPEDEKVQVADNIGVVVTTSTTQTINNDEAFLDDYDDEPINPVAMEPDEYDRAPLSVHFAAGSIAGSLHGVLSGVMEGQILKAPKYTLANTIHHSLAHSLLFGSYESLKRAMLWQIHSADDATQHYGSAYLVAFGLAGGLAGQVQHLASHYSEHVLGLANETLTLSLRAPPTPALRPLLWTFPPSAIGFIAFEYGKKFAT